MLNLERILNEDRLLRSMTGLNRQAFDELLPIFAQAYYESLTPPEMLRKRAIGGGHKGSLKTIELKLFYGLFYCKCYPTSDLAGVLFDFDRAQAHHWAHRLLTVLESALGKRMVLPERKMSSIEEFIERFPGVKRVMFDGTERPMQRPKDNTRQQENYSGKKKRHTRKHMAAVDENKRVLILSKAREGKVHDKRLLNEEGTVDVIPDGIPIEVDLGFQGLKRYNCVAGVYRNRVTNFDDRLMLISTGLWNFYLEAA